MKCLVNTGLKSSKYYNWIKINGALNLERIYYASKVKLCTLQYKILKLNSCQIKTISPRQCVF